MRYRLALPVLAAASAIAACSQAESDAAEPDGEAALTPPVAPAGSEDAIPLASGDWLVEEAVGGASAAFIEDSGTPALVLVCDRARRALSLDRAGSAPTPQRFRITVGTEKADVMLAPGGAAGLNAVVDRNQPIFAAFTDPAAVIEVTGAAAPPLRVPGHAGISRVLAACA